MAESRLSVNKTKEMELEEWLDLIEHIPITPTKWGSAIHINKNDKHYQKGLFCRKLAAAATKKERKPIRSFRALNKHFEARKLNITFKKENKFYYLTDNASGEHLLKRSIRGEMKSRVKINDHQPYSFAAVDSKLNAYSDYTKPQLDIDREKNEQSIHANRSDDDFNLIEIMSDAFSAENLVATLGEHLAMDYKLTDNNRKNDKVACDKKSSLYGYSNHGLFSRPQNINIDIKREQEQEQKKEQKKSKNNSILSNDEFPVPKRLRS